MFILCMAVATNLHAIDDAQVSQSFTQSHISGYVQVPHGKIYYETFKNGNTNHTPIIVLHGGAGKLDHTYLFPQMISLSNHNMVTFYDQRGTGKSLGFNLTSADINIDNYISDLESLRSKLGYKQFVLMR